jgi:sporulation-control protein
MVLSRVGVGAATVDTILPEEEFTPGDRVEATVEMVGGDNTQTIDNIYLKLIAYNRANDDDGTEHVLDTYELFDEAVVLAPDETRTVQTQLRLPLWTPVSVNDDIAVRIDTGLDIDWAVDPTDADEITIAPTEMIEALLTAIEELGFTSLGAQMIEAESWMSDRPLTQKFAFVPEAEPFTAQLDVMGITCIPREDDLRVVVEIDQIDTVADDPEFEDKAEGGDISRLFSDWAEELRETVLVGESPYEDKYGHEIGELDLDFDKQESVHTFENPYPDQISSELRATIRENTDHI